MSTRTILAPIAAFVVVSLSAIGCAAGSADDSASSRAAISTPDTDARCTSLSAMTDEDAQGTAADEFEAADPTAYESCRHSLATNAKTLDEFLKWATGAEINADMEEDPTEAAPSAPRVSKGVVNVTVSRADQTASMIGGPLDLENIRVATGRPGFPTVTGCHDGFKAQKDYVSHKYHAPMPYAVFFYGGEALHQGNIAVKSHGCVHLEQKNAAAVFNAYEAGYTIHVCVN